MNQNVKSVLLLSTGRTGTMFFANLFRELLPQACVYHEAGERSRMINIFTNAHLAGFLPKSLLIWAWRKAIALDLQACSKDYYIDSNNHLYGIVPLIPELYPNLKVIHIVRDPRSYVRSHLNWARHRPRSFIANYLTPFWQPNAFLLREMTLFEWIKASRFERFAWIWDYKNGLIERLEESAIPYLRVRFEDFFGSLAPEQWLNQILRFMGLPEVSGVSELFRCPVNPNKGQSFPKWPDWSPWQCHRLYILCGDRMERYGYGGEQAWMEKIEAFNSCNNERIKSGRGTYPRGFTGDGVKK